MQPNDDEKFEKFLRQFQPRAPKPLPIELPEREGRPLPTFPVWAAAVAAMVVLAVVTVKHGSHETGVNPAAQNSAGVEQLMDQQPLTIASANAVLARAPSVKAAVDQIAFRPQATQLPKGKHSALAVLSEEKIKL